MAEPRKRSLAGGALVVALLLGTAVPAAAVRDDPPAGGAAAAKPFFDSRAGARAAAGRAGTTVAAARPGPRTIDARGELRRRLGAEGVLDVDPLTGTPRQLLRTDGALSSPRGGDRTDIALDFVRANRVALGLSDPDIDGLDLLRRATTARGVTVVHFRQLYRGIPAFDNDLRVAIDRGGRVVSVAGSPQHELSVPAIEPQLGAAEALDRLQRNVGAARPVELRSGPDGVRRMTRFARGDFARLVLFGAADGARLAWHVRLHASSTVVYSGVVDATSGAILYRQNLVKDVASASVYPNHPGASAPVTVDLEDYGLIPGSNVLTGSWARAWSDVDDDDEIDPAEEIGPSAGTDFVYPFTPFTPADPGCPAEEPCAWDPADRDSWLVNRRQNGVQAFYLVSRFHDHLAGPEVAFTDDWGNFELGGTGGDDPVLVNADDGADTEGDGGPDDAHKNNATMSTPPDGESPTMQMYVFEDSGSPDQLDFRNMNGGDDSGVVWHEYTHGLSNRLVINAEGEGALGSPHAGAMGEAWSDWFASDLQVRDGLKSDDLAAPGEIDVGDYSDLDPHTLRSQALDCPVGAVTPSCPGGFSTAVGGYTLGDFGKVFTGPEVHADGEIWSETLWDLRQVLEIKTGSAAAASDLAEILVADGMRFSPPEPTMLDMRNSILTADQADFGGQLHDLLWDVFRKRGMGYFAAATDGGDTHPAEDFTEPPDPNGPKGSVTGVVTDSNSGLPIEGVLVAFGGHASRPDFDEFLADETDMSGRYTIENVPEGTYPKLAFTASAGYDAGVARNVVITQDSTTTRDAALQRDWASLSGGATIESVSDDTGGPFGCGVDRAFDQSQGSAWSAFNPTSEDPDNPEAGPPTVVLELPRTIDVTAFLIDPSAGCGDGASSTTREYTLETSPNGTTFQMAVNGTGANGFTDANIGLLNRREPAGVTGRNVRFIRLTMLSPLRQGDDCAPAACSGTDFIDMTELEVLGGAPNVLPSGALGVSPSDPAQGEPVSFNASFTDPDSAITGYSWDFDGNGSVDRTTAGPTTSFAYGSQGRFTARVAANDFRGGSGSASATLTVGPPEPLPQGPAGPPGAGLTRLPALELPARGRNGGVSARVTCAQRCRVHMLLRLGPAARRKLGPRRALDRFKKTIAGGGSLRVRLTVPKRVRRAARRHGMRRIGAVLVVKAVYSDGRSRTRRRAVTIRL